jgi:hypothetical protein
MSEERKRYPEEGAEDRREEEGAPLAGGGEGGAAARGDGGERGTAPPRRRRGRPRIGKVVHVIHDDVPGLDVGTAHDRLLVQTQRGADDEDGARDRLE